MIKGSLLINMTMYLYFLRLIKGFCQCFYDRFLFKICGINVVNCCFIYESIGSDRKHIVNNHIINNFDIVLSNYTKTLKFFTVKYIHKFFLSPTFFLEHLKPLQFKLKVYCSSKFLRMILNVEKTISICPAFSSRHKK